VLDNRCFLVIDQNFLRHTPEVLKAADQALVGMFGVFAVRAPEVEDPRRG